MTSRSRVPLGVRGLTVAAAAVALVLLPVALGGGLFSGGVPHADVDELTAVLDTTPLPPDAVLLEQRPAPGHGDRPTTVLRTYRTVGDQPACVQLIHATTGTGWVVNSRLGGRLDPATCDPAVPHRDYTDPGNDEQRRGYLRRGGGSVHVEWRRGWLAYTLDENALPG